MYPTGKKKKKNVLPKYKLQYKQVDDYKLIKIWIL